MAFAVIGSNHNAPIIQSTGNIHFLSIVPNLRTGFDVGIAESCNRNLVIELPRWLANPFTIIKNCYDLAVSLKFW